MNEKSDCAFVSRHLKAYIEGSAETQTEQQINDHLADCPNCAQTVETAQSLSRKLSRDAKKQRGQISQDASARIQKNLYRKIDRAIGLHTAITRSLPIVGLIALVLVAAYTFRAALPQSSEVTTLQPHLAPMTMGDPTAPVKVVEYVDYQSPYCAEYEKEALPTLNVKLVDSGRIYYEVRNNPMETIHPLSRQAAKAARCAGEQASFWPMHTALLRDQAKWGRGSATMMIWLESASAELDLDADTLIKCVKSDRYDAIIDADQAQAHAAGLSTAPAFTINKLAIEGTTPYEKLAQYVVDAENSSTVQINNATMPTALNVNYQPAAFTGAIGDPNAPVTIVEFTDYECPFCLRHHETVYGQLLEQYIETGQVRYIVKDYPMSGVHGKATIAAQAAHCANEQGQFSSMHTRLFADRKQWEASAEPQQLFVQYADDLGLDETQFELCMSSDRYNIAVIESIQEGAALGVRGTPSFVINGQLVRGAQPYDVFEQIIAMASAETQP